MDSAQGAREKGNLLVVDDDLTARQTMEAFLTREGYDVRLAPNGEMTLMVAKEDPPELILLDIRLPDMDGFKVCQLLKGDQKTRDIPVIFISGLGDVVDKVKGFAAGGLDYITKPFQAEEMLARLETHLTLRRLQRQVEVKTAQLQRAHDELEERVKERTADLARVNEQLVASEKVLHERFQMNEIKEKIVDQIFMTLGRNQGVKMKDLFNLVIPALVDIIKIQRCALFSVQEDSEQAVLEAGYPEAGHGIGKTFSVKESYINAVVNLNVPMGDFGNQTICYDYILIKNPQESDLIPPSLERFLESQAIHSVLYVPLRVSGAVKYFLVFDSKDQHERFSNEEIEILTFFGKELMKGLRLERMADILHDFKNPAIAAAGFAKKVKGILQHGLFPSESEKICHWLDIICEETSRIQDLGLTLLGEGKEEVVDLTERLKKRFLINKEALEELRREKIRLVEQGSGTPLTVRCFPLHLDRILDNLLSNATNAVPGEGGVLSIQSYQKDTWGVAEIVNTGRISEEDKERLLLSDGRGRGHYITFRLLKHMGGRLEMETLEGQTISRLSLPIVKMEGTRTSEELQHLPK
jgi:DNA-binding response OmpR family regulator/signal transduction histidine kinase